MRLKQCCSSSVHSQNETQNPKVECACTNKKIVERDIDGIKLSSTIQE